MSVFKEFKLKKDRQSKGDRKNCDNMDDTTEHFQFSGDILSKKQLVKTWKSLTRKPFPYGKIRAVVLDTEEADKAWEALRNSHNMRNCSLQEYGKDLPLDRGTTAVTFLESRGDSKGWVILIRKDSRVGLAEDLRHELSHIIQGDITLDGKSYGQPIE